MNTPLNAAFYESSFLRVSTLCVLITRIYLLSLALRLIDTLSVFLSEAKLKRDVFMFWHSRLSFNNFWRSNRPKCVGWSSATWFSSFLLNNTEMVDSSKKRTYGWFFHAKVYALEIRMIILQGTERVSRIHEDHNGRIFVQVLMIYLLAILHLLRCAVDITKKMTTCSSHQNLGKPVEMVKLTIIENK